MNREKAERNLKIGLFGAMLTLIGDCLIGAAKFPDGANLIEGYFAIALAMLIMPLLPSGNSALESVAGNVRKTIDDYLFFTDARTTFSLFSTGW